MQKCALYLRCSTSHQDLDYQESACREAVQARGWEVQGVYADAAVSGTKESREAFDRMLAAARAGEVHAVVAVASDRISRSLKHLLNVEAELSALGVGLLLLRGQCDTTTPSGRLMFSMVGAFAQFERDTIAARIKQALAEKRKQGVRLGRPRQHTISNADLRGLRDGGLTLRQLATRTGLAVSTIQRALRAAA